MAPVEAAEGVPVDAPVAEAEPVPVVAKPVEVKKPMKKAKQVVLAKEEDLKYIFYFYRPQLIEKFWKLELTEGEDPETVRKACTHIEAAGQYCYAVFG